ncbi:MAG: hypothetical protein WD771_05005 [Gemmatimonadaceae bacterium]
MAIIDVFREFAAAQQAGIVRRYAIGGAIGATFYIEPSATEDVDVFIAAAPAPNSALISLAPVLEFFKRRGATIEGEHLVIHG